MLGIGKSTRSREGEILHRVEFGGVRRETFHPDFAVESGNILADELAAMDAGPVPDDEQLAGDMALEMAQKLDDPLAGDGSLVEPEVKVLPGESRDGRELVPVEVELQYGRLPLWAPRAHPKPSPFSATPAPSSTAAPHARKAICTAHSWLKKRSIELVQWASRRGDGDAIRDFHLLN
jgi:hypothetical protein